MRNRITEFAVSVIWLTSMMQPAYADQKAWQMATLFSPSPAQIEREEEGRVMIYHGMKDVDVERAMDDQFHRIETMMFTGTIVTDDTGQPLRDPKTGLVVTEDDGC
jgi:hypothetical protein